MEAGEAVRRPGAARYFRLSRGHSQGERLRHRRDRPASQRHVLHARELTEPIVQYTLEPLVYVGPAEGKPKDEWKLKSARELLDLKICDMACGSGAFLVQACRYMAERLLEAWEEAEKDAQVASKGSLRESGQRSSTAVRITPLRRSFAGRIVRATDPARSERTQDLRPTPRSPSGACMGWTRIRWLSRWRSCRCGC